jgi:hypothetical protein
MDSFNKSIKDYIMEISKTFVFQKIAFNGTRKINTPEVEIALECNNSKYEFSACGSIWNSKHTDTITGGQCLDTMYKYLKHDKLFKEIYRLWKLYHLNGMRSGTIKQEQALDDAEKAGVRLFDYDDSCKYLESIGLLEDDGYKYGTKWLYRAIPEDDLKIIKDLLTK